MKITKSELKQIIKEELGKLTNYQNFGMLGSRSKILEQKLSVNDIQKKISTLSISDIAGIISEDWDNVWYGAKPYLYAMFSMDKITDNYGLDPGTSIIAYFLGNAAQWKGPIAKIVKAELNKRLKRGR